MSRGLRRMPVNPPLSSRPSFRAALGPTLAPPVPLPGGGNDLYIQQDKFQAQFAADVPAINAWLMAATQRPITEAALNEASANPAWKTIPAWFVYGEKDKNIPAQVQAFMAERAKSKRRSWSRTLRAW